MKTDRMTWSTVCRPRRSACLWSRRRAACDLLGECDDGLLVAQFGGLGSLCVLAAAKETLTGFKRRRWCQGRCSCPRLPEPFERILQRGAQPFVACGHVAVFDGELSRCQGRRLDVAADRQGRCC